MMAYTSFGKIGDGYAVHYGVRIDTSMPITGVRQINRCSEWIYDTINQGIDLDWEEHLSECEEEDHDSCGPCEQSNVLIGGWKKDSDGKWEPDQSAEYSAIAGQTVLQIVWSRHTRRSALCSPCFPGQADNDSEGDYLAFDLPPDMIRDL